jgi:hypothetical protein
MERSGHAGRDWRAWHEAYDDPATRQSRRLRTVQACIRESLDRARPGPIRVVSVCAGEGRDLLGVLPGHPRRGDVRARLVELDASIARIARDAAHAAGLTGVEVMRGDASVTDAYAGAVPADLVLVCGVFGNLRDADVERTVSLLPRLCADGAEVIWTRGRRAPDLTPAICGWFESHGFRRLWLSPLDGLPEDLPDEAVGEPRYAVGVHRFEGDPQPLEPGVRIFTFLGSGGRPPPPGREAR